MIGRIKSYFKIEKRFERRNLHSVAVFDKNWTLKIPVDFSVISFFLGKI